MKYIVTGIGTDVGKTVASAILALALEADYWKPVQAGELDNSDSDKIRSLTEGKLNVIPASYSFTSPMSPHAAAKIDQINVDIAKIQVPDSNNNLIIEGAGGVMVPLTDNFLFIDWFEQVKLPVILVSRHYVGSINHTLLTIEALRLRNIEIKGIVFVGDENQETESIILKTKIQFLGRIPLTSELNSEFIKEQAEIFKTTFQNV